MRYAVRKRSQTEAGDTAGFVELWVNIRWIATNLCRFTAGEASVGSADHFRGDGISASEKNSLGQDVHFKAQAALLRKSMCGNRVSDQTSDTS